jgi:type II secretion system protein D
MPNPSHFLRFRTLLFAAVAALILAPVAEAQTRPGGVNRGTGATGTALRRGATGGSLGAGSRGTGPRQYRSNTELGDAIIQIDPETRSLVIVTDEETHGELMKVISTLDRPKPQVLIKVIFVEVTYNKDSDLGVEGSYTFNLSNSLPGQTGSRTTTTNSTSQTGSAANPGTSTTTSTVTTPLNIPASLASTIGASSVFGIPTAAGTEGTFLRIVNDDWSATLRALASKGKVEVLSRPSIMARNNQEAVIVVGQEIPFITNSRITDDGQTINTVTYDNIGIILRVTPFITSEGTVEMIVAPEISSLTDQTIPISDTVSSPIIAKRSAETVVVTPNAKTVVIGGLMETSRLESVRKVPILGDIPVLGFAFRRTIKSDVKRELLIFLTPYIVNRPESLPQMSRKEVGETSLIEGAFPRSEYDRFLDGPSLFPERNVETEVRIEERTEETSTKQIQPPAGGASVPRVQTSPAQVVRTSAQQRSAPTAKAATPVPARAVPVTRAKATPAPKTARSAKPTPKPRPAEAVRG